MMTVVLRELPEGGWHATAFASEQVGISWTDRLDPITAIHDCLERAGIKTAPILGKSQHDALERALGDAVAARKAR